MTQKEVWKWLTDALFECKNTLHQHGVPDATRRDATKELDMLAAALGVDQHETEPEEKKPAHAKKH